MSRPYVLILDGASLPFGGVEGALQAAGWEATVLSSEAAPQASLPLEPSLVLLDPARSGEAGLKAVQALRGRFPELPVVVLKEAGATAVAGHGFHVPIPGTAGILDLATPLRSWGASLNTILGTVRAERNKFTAEDLFADILADLDGPSKPVPPAVPEAPPAPAPPPPAPEAAPTPVAAPAPVVAPGAPPRPADPLRTTPLRLPEVKVPLAKPPVPKPAPSKPIPAALGDLFGDLLGSAPGVPAPRPPKEVEFTLSGISGIKDPFQADAPAPAPPPAPADVLEGPFRNGDVEIEFVGTGDSTPAAAPPRPGMPRIPAIPVPPAPEPPVEGAEEFGNYYLLEKIAVGGMAELFKARQRGVHNFEKIVAIKRILPHLSDNDEFVRMFIDEAKLAAQLTHPNIVQIFDLGKASGFYYIAMEFVDGRDLRSLLRKVREYRLPFPEPVAAFVAMKVAGALDYAHRKKGMNDKELKLVHRDISPQNILIGAEGGVKLVDFGIAKAATKSTQTMAGALKGKLLYMSPEQALGISLDSRSDIYSLGLVLFELLTGERCFQADSELGVLEKVRLGRVQDIRSVNPSVTADMASILERALQKDVEKRYPSARLLERDLKGLLSRQANEPTEHEVAEYVSTLLRGTREQLEALVAAHWPPQAKAAGREPSQPVAVLRTEDPPTAVEAPRSPANDAVAPPDLFLERPRRRGWLLPLAVILVMIVAILLGWVVTR